MVILGVDPGTRIAGYAIVDQVGGRVRVLACSGLNLGTKEDLVTRVGRFYEVAEQLILEYKVSDIALETSFLGKHNPASFLKLGYIRGALYVLAHRHQLGIHEFSPSQIKQSIAGSGGADKEQVLRVLKRLFPDLADPKTYDASDALAVALTGSWLAAPSVVKKVVSSREF